MSEMKIQIQRTDFFHLASQAYSLIERRNVMPILSKVYIKAKKKPSLYTGHRSRQ